MLTLKLTIDKVTEHGIEPDVLTGTLTVLDASVLAEGIEVLCTDALAYLNDGPDAERE